MIPISPNRNEISFKGLNINPDQEDYFIEQLSDADRGVVRVFRFEKINKSKLMTLELNSLDFNSCFRTRALSIQELNQKINEGDRGLYTAQLTLKRYW